MVVGDMNDMAYVADKEDVVIQDSRRVVNFKAMMDDCGLRTCATKGVLLIRCL